MSVGINKVFYLFVIVSIIFSSSCTFEKRLYTKGFYASNNTATKKINKYDTSLLVSVFKSIKQTKKKEDITYLFAQVSKITSTNHLMLLQNRQKISFAKTCDTIILKNGGKLTGTITKITGKKIFFKNCDSINYYSSSINKTDVNDINFANGNKGLQGFKKNETPRKRINFFRVIGSVFIFLGLIFLILFYKGVSSNIGMALLLLFLAIIFLLCGFILGIISLFDTKS